MHVDFNQLHENGADIALIIPPPLWTKMPHLGVAYLSRFLKSQGLKVNVYDFNLHLYNNASEDLHRYWQIDCLNSFFVTEVSRDICRNFQQEILEFAEELLMQDIAVFGFSVNIISIFVANEIARLIKQKDKSRVIIFGGPAVFFKSHRKLLKECFADFFVIGEGEKILLNLLSDIKSGRKVRNGNSILLGKFYNRKDVFAAKPVEDLDTIPFPDFSEFNLSDYNRASDYRPLPLISSRGCIGRCSYCIDCIMWPGYRYRSAINVFAEIKYQVTKNNATAFEFNDLTCNGKLKQLSELCDLIIESGLKFSWVSYAIIRKEMDAGLFRKLKDAGCHTLIYGVESGSDNILRKMHKIYTAADTEKIIRLTHQAGICANVNIIVGFPQETEAEFNETADFLSRNKSYIDAVTNVSGFTLFPEAEVGRFRNRYGVVWREGLDPMLHRDRNGLDRQGRHARVAKMSQILEELGIQKTIINKPKLNPVVGAA